MADSPMMGILAATVWGAGVCFMWPTMLATASERFPQGGALLMGMMGTAGTLSIYFVLPKMGAIFDAKKIEAAGGEAAFKALNGPELDRVLGLASQASFRSVAILPAILLVGVRRDLAVRSVQGRVQGCEAVSRLTRTFTSMREPRRLMIDINRSTVNRPRSALRIREKSAAAIPVLL